jgi:hypothetical protein
MERPRLEHFHRVEFADKMALQVYCDGMAASAECCL